MKNKIEITSFEGVLQDIEHRNAGFDYFGSWDEKVALIFFENGKITVLNANPAKVNVSLLRKYFLGKKVWINDISKAVTMENIMLIDASVQEVKETKQ
jgi:hypothetical protein